MKKILLLFALLPVLAWGQSTTSLNKNSGSGNMTYPGAGIALSTGIAWGTSITNSSANWNTAYTDRLKWDGGATGLVAATGRTSLGATTVGAAFFMLTNPSAITFPRINADNSLTAQSAADFKTSLSLQNVTNESKATMFTSPTFTGIATSPTFSASGAIAASGALGVAGYQFKTVASTITESQPLGTRTLAAANGFATPTFAADNAVTLTSATTLYIASAPAAGANITIANPYSLYVAEGNSYLPDTIEANVLIATGVISGAVDVTLDTDPTVVLTDAMCKNMVRINNDADVIDYTLPGAATGLIILFYDVAGGVITIDAASGDEIYLNGASVGAGDAIDSPGVVGNFICLMAIDNTRWISLGQSGTWIDGGAD